MAPHLTSWTRTLNVEDALTLIDAARAGSPVAEWTLLADEILPQSSPARRRELIRIVREELLDLDAQGLVRSTCWLRLFQHGSPHCRHGLLFGRLWQKRPLVIRALDELVLPALARADRPLAAHDSDLIEPPAWDDFLRAALRPDVPGEAFIKTRSTLQAALRDVGVLELTGSRARTTRVRHARPDPLAFAWVLGDELATERERSEAWALRDSFAARLFAPRSDYAATCIEQGIAAGLLRRGHLMGQTRLHPGPEIDPEVRHEPAHHHHRESV